MSSLSLAEVGQQFSLAGRFAGGGSHGNGHINDTFVVVYEQDGRRIRYILQRINRRVFRDVPALMENIARVSAHVGARVRGADSGPRREALTLIPTRTGRPFYRDAAGDYWRAYVFIEGASTHDLVQSPRQAYEAALAFGQFQRDLADLPGPPLRETIPDFHDTRKRLLRLEQVVAADPAGRTATAQAEIAFAGERQDLAGALLDLHARGAVPLRTTHNDTKLNNVMLDDTTGRGVCVIDLDTVMPGLALYDFGDMVRFASNTAVEDETDLSLVRADLRVFAALVEGYRRGAGDMLNEAEVAHLVLSARLITLEIGVRFLTDYLEGDVYFKTRRLRHNLDRCRNQFALVRSMEAQADQMHRLVDSVTP